MYISDWTTVESFLAPVKSLLDDEDITNIMANPDGKVYFEKRGRKHLAPDIDFPDQFKSIALQNLARMAGQDIDKGNPCLTVRLPDGGRLAGATPRVVRGGHALTIRRFPKNPFTLDQLENFESFPHEVATLLRAELRSGSNMLIVGSTNSGKTTLLNALCSEMKDSLRIAVIEDVAELNINKPDVLCFQVLENSETSVSIRDLLKQTLRHNPNRIIMGEMRSGEAYDFLQALNSGHTGCMSTIHARSASMALTRLTDLVQEANSAIPYFAIQRNIAAALDVVIFQTYDEDTGRREIDHILRVDDYDNDRHIFCTTELYRKSVAPRLHVAATGHAARHANSSSDSMIVHA